MSAHPVSATASSRADTALPNRFVIRDLLGWAGPALGLKSAVLNTLDVLLSFLPPKRDHHMVFASNVTILNRAQGLSERSLRRHIQLLQETGLLTRHDSPNRKRFIRRASDEALRFGLDLGPLFDKIDFIAALADQAREEAQSRALLLQRVRSACHRRLVNDPTDGFAVATMRLLRRKLSFDHLSALLAEAEELSPKTPEMTDMAANDGENDRHHKNNNKDIKFKTSKEATQLAAYDVIEACPEAACLSPNPLQNWCDLDRFAERMSKLLCLPDALYQKAITMKGKQAVTLIIMMMIQNAKKIRNNAAYFAALTCGKLANSANPITFFHRKLRKLSADNACRAASSVTCYP